MIIVMDAVELTVHDQYVCHAYRHPFLYRALGYREEEFQDGRLLTAKQILTNHNTETDEYNYDAAKAVEEEKCKAELAACIAGNNVENELNAVVAAVLEEGEIGDNEQRGIDEATAPASGSPSETPSARKVRRKWHGFDSPLKSLSLAESNSAISPLKTVSESQTAWQLKAHSIDFAACIAANDVEAAEDKLKETIAAVLEEGEIDDDEQRQIDEATAQLEQLKARMDFDSVCSLQLEEWEDDEDASPPLANPTLLGVRSHLTFEDCIAANNIEAAEDKLKEVIAVALEDGEIDDDEQREIDEATAQLEQLKARMGFDSVCSSPLEVEASVIMPSVECEVNNGTQMEFERFNAKFQSAVACARKYEWSVSKCIAEFATIETYLKQHPPDNAADIATVAAEMVVHKIKAEKLLKRRQARMLNKVIQCTRNESGSVACLDAIDTWATRSKAANALKVEDLARSAVSAGVWLDLSSPLKPSQAQSVSGLLVGESQAQYLANQIEPQYLLEEIENQERAADGKSAREANPETSPPREAKSAVATFTANQQKSAVAIKGWDQW